MLLQLYVCTWFSTVCVPGRVRLKNNDSVSCSIIKLEFYWISIWETVVFCGRILFQLQITLWPFGYLHFTKNKAVCSKLERPISNVTRPVFSWSVFIRAVIDHMICYNLNWSKNKLWVHYFIFSCTLDHILKS